MAKNRTSPAALWPLDKLVPYSKNPRTHSDAQIAQLADSIEEFGFANPVLVDTKAGILLAGHGRLRAAQKLGLAKVPVLVLDHLTETQKRADILADNKLAENAGWGEHRTAPRAGAHRGCVRTPCSIQQQRCKFQNIRTPVSTRTGPAGML